MAETDTTVDLSEVEGAQEFLAAQGLEGVNTLNDALTKAAEKAAAEAGKGNEFDAAAFLKEQAKALEADHLNKYAESEQPLENLAKGYAELLKLQGNFTGAPKDGYSLEVKDDFKELVTDDDLQAIQGKAAAMNMSNQALQDWIDWYFDWQFTTDENAVKAEMEKLGDNAEQRITDASDFLKANLDADEFAAVQAFATTAKGVEAIEKLIQMGGKTASPRTHGGPMTGKKTQSELDEMRFAQVKDGPNKGKLKYDVDPEYRTQVDQAFRETHGTDPQVQIVDPFSKAAS